jgi:ATP-dependent helicase/nuclease subunit A
VARRIQDIVGHLEINTHPPRRARYADVTLLYAKRTDIQVFEEAFKAAGIPFITDRRGELLSTLEARDITVLLTTLVDPHDDLALAHALKSPIFGLTDDDLMVLAAEGEAPWWDRLACWSARDDAPAPVRRAADLLTAWRSMAGTVPIHDLLDRIYHQGNVSAHYALSVPVHMHATVQANLEGFLALSLALSGGRYPSLPRFLDELRRLRDTAGQDGPDEPPAASGDRVRMLTIHSAKGLESPVVFLIKADATAGRDEPQGVLMDWPPDADRPRHFSLYGPKDWRGPGRDNLFQQEKAQADVERLNLLYVAMTRARQALFVSGIRQKDEDGAGWLGELSRALESTDMDGLPTMTWHATTLSAPSAGMPEPAAMPAGSLAGIGTRRPRETHETAFGTLLHAWLEHQTAGMAPDAIRALLHLDAAHAGTLASMAGRMLSQPQLAPAFDPASYQHAHNELEFLDEEGRVARMDRLVEFEREIWVLDYKSGGLDEPDPSRRAAPHEEQMARYRHAAQALFPHKPVRAALVFADGEVHWM